MDPAEIRRVNFIQPGQFPLTTPTGGQLRLRRVREGARRGARRRPATPSCAPSRRRAGVPATSKQLGIGVSTYVEVTAPVGLHIEFGAVEIHDDGSRQRVRRHERARPGPPHRVRDARPATCSASRWTRSRSSTPTPHACRAAPARWARARCRRRAARSTSRRTRCSTGPSRSPRTCSRRRPTTSSSATAACTSPACRRRA